MDIEVAWRMVIVNGRLGLKTFCSLSGTCKRLRAMCIRIITRLVRSRVIRSANKRIVEVADYNHCLNVAGPVEDDEEGKMAILGEEDMSFDDFYNEASHCSYDSNSCKNWDSSHELCTHVPGSLRRSAYDDEDAPQYDGMILALIHEFLFRPTARACTLSDLVILHKGYAVFHTYNLIGYIVFPSRPEEIRRPDELNEPASVDELIDELRRQKKRERDPSDCWAEFKDALICKRQRVYNE